MEHLTVKELIRLSKDKSLTGEAYEAFLQRQQEREAEYVDLSKMPDGWLDERYGE